MMDDGVKSKLIRAMDIFQYYLSHGIITEQDYEEHLDNIWLISGEMVTTTKTWRNDREFIGEPGLACGECLWD